MKELYVHFYIIYITSLQELKINTFKKKKKVFSVAWLQFWKLHSN